MSKERIEIAAQRIEVALRRIAAVADSIQAAPPSVSALVVKHETLRDSVANSLKDLDGLLERLEE